MDVVISANGICTMEIKIMSDRKMCIYPSHQLGCVEFSVGNKMPSGSTDCYCWAWLASALKRECNTNGNCLLCLLINCKHGAEEKVLLVQKQLQEEKILVMSMTCGIVADCMCSSGC